jgi:endonuclease-3
MTRRKQIAQAIGTILDTLIPHPTIPLHHCDPFTLLVAVLLSAQCSDEQVNAVTPKLFAVAPTPEAMAACTICQIYDIIRPCGLAHRKASALHRLCHMLIHDFGGEVPRTLSDLESLPGVGHKTASVIASHYGYAYAFPVDRHIFRSARRWQLSNGTTVRKVEEDLKRLFPKSTWAQRHLQIILFARTWCPAKGHDPAQCPICRELPNF